MKKKLVRVLLFFFLLFLVPAYSQNIVNVGLSNQELKNGIRLFNERHYAAAIQAFEMALSYEPLNYAAKYRLGKAFLYAGYAQNAVRVWEELVHAGVADYQVMESVNSLSIRLSMDKDYNYLEPYIFRKYYDGFVDANHYIIKPSFIVYDITNGTKFVSSSGTGLVIEIDSANSIQRKYGSRFFRPKLLKMPTGIALYNDQIYIADYSQNKIFVFNRDLIASEAFSFGDAGFLSNQIFGPMGLVFSKDEYLYVVDNGNARIQKFLPDGVHIYSFGEGFLFRPTDIVCKDGFLYVSDIDKNRKGRVVQFDREGNFIKLIGADFLKEPRGLLLDGDELYISDASGSLYIYDTQDDTSRSFSANDDKLIQPFDLVKDMDGILWRTDFNNQNIGVYTPLQGIYGNVILDVSQILVDDYPYVYMIVRVRNKDGSPLIQISKDELVLSEFDQPVKDLIVSGMDQYRSNMLTHLVIDRSLESERYLPQLEYYVKTFLSNNTGKDLIEVTLIDDKTYTSSRMPASVSVVWNFITNHQPKADTACIWDIPIYNSVTSLFNNLRNRAVIVFTSGSIANNSFSAYGSDVIQTYADQNSIPIYVVNFSGSNSRIWKDISEKSYGRYFHAGNDAGGILDLYNTIKTSIPLEYLVEYKAHNYSAFPNVWIDASLYLNRFGVNGMTSTGYYVPPPMKPLHIDLQGNFFPPVSSVTEE